MVIHNCGKRSLPFGFKQLPVQSDFSTGKCDGFCHGQDSRQEEQCEEAGKIRFCHLCVNFLKELLRVKFRPMFMFSETEEIHK